MARTRRKAEPENVWLRPSHRIQTEQRWLLLAALSYNCDDEVLSTDAVYDHTISYLLGMQQEHPEVWAQSPVYPEVFQDEEKAWAYTSQHFPQNAEIRQWLEDQWDRVADFRGAIDDVQRSGTEDHIVHIARLRRERRGDGSKRRRRRVLPEMRSINSAPTKRRVRTRVV